MRTVASIVWIIYIIFYITTAKDIFNTLPPLMITSFTCNGRDTGFYADIENNCRLYHTCDNYGNKFTYYCPQDTAFRQETLVCDHAYLVDCKKSAKLIPKISKDVMDLSKKISIDSETNQRSNSYSRSYHIDVQPSIFLLAPKQNNEDTTTFVMSSTVFLRDKSPSQNNYKSPIYNQNSPSYKLLPENYSLTTFRPQQFNHNLEGMTDFQNYNMSKILSFDKSINDVTNTASNVQKFSRPVTTSRYNTNYLYSETLRSIQTKPFEGHITTTPKITTAGTEFPIPHLAGTHSELNNYSEDPYYPPKRINTEANYIFNAKNKHYKSFATYSQRPWQKKLDLQIPEVLPDLNLLEDLVDRRKYLYINKAKDTFVRA